MVNLVGTGFSGQEEMKSDFTTPKVCMYDIVLRSHTYVSEFKLQDWRVGWQLS